MQLLLPTWHVYLPTLRELNIALVQGLSALSSEAGDSDSAGRDMLRLPVDSTQRSPLSMWTTSHAYGTSAKFLVLRNEGSKRFHR